MKRTLTLTLSLFFVLTLQAQKYGGPAAVNTSTTEYSRESTFSNINMSIEYPIDGNDPYLKAFDEHVLGDIASLVHVNPEAAGPDIQTKNVEDATKVIGLYFADQAKTANEDLEDAVQYAFTATVKKVYSNHLYVTFSLEADVFEGGAHGMPMKEYYTIDRVTGHIYTYDEFFPSSVNTKLANIIRRNMLASGDYTKDDFFEAPALPEIKNIGLTDKGIIFQFQAYEVGCFALGLPEGIVPWSQAYSIMTEKGKALSLYKPSATANKTRTK